MAVTVRIQSFAQLAPVGTLLGLAVKFQLHPIIQDRLPAGALLLRQLCVPQFLAARQLVQSLDGLSDFGARSNQRLNARASEVSPTWAESQLIYLPTGITCGLTIVAGYSNSLRLAHCGR